jgi:hypothetical protein
MILDVNSLPNGACARLESRMRDCVKIRSFPVLWGTAAQTRLEWSRIPYSPLIRGEKWGARPFSFRSLDFSHSLVRRNQGDGAATRI